MNTQTNPTKGDIMLTLIIYTAKMIALIPLLLLLLLMAPVLAVINGVLQYLTDEQDHEIH